MESVQETRRWRVAGACPFAVVVGATNSVAALGSPNAVLDYATGLTLAIQSARNRRDGGSP